MTRRMSSRRISLPLSFMLLAAGGLAACDSPSEDDYEDGHFYCADANGVVVDEDLCDESSPNYNSGSSIFYMGSSVHAPPSGYSTYPVGSRMPSNAVKFPVTDTVSRAKYGLPATGRVSNGTVKTGVIGKGGAGSTAVKGGGTGVSGGKSGGG